MFSQRYLKAAMKHLDGMSVGSASLWGARAGKGYGMFPDAQESSTELEDVPEFNYSPTEIAMAKRVRVNFFERVLTPKEIANALRYSPVTMDIEIYSSAWTDQGGVLTIPDEDDIKEEVDHCVTVYNHDSGGLWVDTGWPNWGDNGGNGYISFEYLEKYFITAFSVIVFDNLITKPIQKLLSKSKIMVRGAKWFTKMFSVPSMRGDLRPLFNLEVYSSGGVLAGWVHFAKDENQTVEILELFVLPEFRRRGVGTFLFQHPQSFLKAKKVQSYIASHDLGMREEAVKDFLLSNNYLVVPDRSKFYDCRLRIEPL